MSSSENDVPPPCTRRGQGEVCETSKHHPPEVPPCLRGGRLFSSVVAPRNGMGNSLEDALTIESFRRDWLYLFIHRGTQGVPGQSGALNADREFFDA